VGWNHHRKSLTGITADLSNNGQSWRRFARSECFLVSTVKVKVKVNVDLYSASS